MMIAKRKLFNSSQILSMARTYRRVVTKEPHHKSAVPYKRHGRKISIDIDDYTIEIEKLPTRRSY